MFRMSKHLIIVTLTLIILSTSAITFAQTNTTHTVSSGETLATIAQKYNVDWYALANLNGIVNPNLIYVGQVLIIPTEGTGAGGTPPTNGAVPGTIVRYYVRVADTLSNIAVQYCTTVAAIANASGINIYAPIYPGQSLYIPVGYCYPNGPVYGYPPHDRPVVTYPPQHHHGTRYIVRAGDTLYRIGAIFGVNIYRIAEANGILNLNHIYRGQTLIIPSR